MENLSRSVAGFTVIVIDHDGCRWTGRQRTILLHFYSFVVFHFLFQATSVLFRLLAAEGERKKTKASCDFHVSIVLTPLLQNFDFQGKLCIAYSVELSISREE